MRIFIALLLPEQIRDELAATADRLRSCCAKGNFTKTENYHLTLRFLGECSERQALELGQLLEQLACQTPAFDLTLGACGSFTKGQQQILWRGLLAPHQELDQLVQRLEKALAHAGWPPEKRPYAPHLTLARQAVLSQPLEALTPALSPLNFTARQIAVMESCRLDGQLTYLPLAVAQLA